MSLFLVYKNIRVVYVHICLVLKNNFSWWPSFSPGVVLPVTFIEVQGRTRSCPFKRLVCEPRFIRAGVEYFFCIY